jgi:hypothetical protein
MAQFFHLKQNIWQEDGEIIAFSSDVLFYLYGNSLNRFYRAGKTVLQSGWTYRMGTDQYIRKDKLHTFIL